MSRETAVPADPVGGDQGRAQRAAALKFALMGLSGASIEWYDFFLYATAAALVFPTVFFPATLSPLLAQLASFSTFAVGFVARPVGAVVFGHMGDRLGRKTAFAVALVMMGAATTLIGVLPSYQTAGFFSPLALVLLRLTQGLAVGGQWGGATLLATENAPKSRRGLYGGIAQAGVPVGVVMANLAFLAANGSMSAQAFVAFGWRIPFLLSLVLVGLGLYIHLRTQDTAAYRRLQQSKPTEAVSIPSRRAAHSPVLEALRLYPGLILVAAGVYVPATLSFYILITYVVAYGTSSAGLQLTRSTMLTAVLIANVARLPVDVLSGSLSDRYGRRRILLIGTALMGIWAFILFPLIETRSLLWITVAIGVGSWLVSTMYGPLAAMFAELFSTRVRYSAVSLAFQTGAIVGGGLAPVIATGLYARFHNNLWISVYMAAACLMSLVCASTLKETRNMDLAL
jgi:MFS family permease